MANTKVVGSNTPKKRFFRILMVILIIGLCLLMLSPFIWMIRASEKRSRCYETGSWIIPHLLVSPELFTGTWVCGKDKLSFFTGLLEFYQGSCHLCSGGGSQQLPGRLRLRKTEIPRL